MLHSLLDTKRHAYNDLILLATFINWRDFCAFHSLFSWIELFTLLLLWLLTYRFMANLHTFICVSHVCVQSKNAASYILQQTTPSSKPFVPWWTSNYRVWVVNGHKTARDVGTRGSASLGSKKWGKLWRLGVILLVVFLKIVSKGGYVGPLGTRYQ